ncbi:MAG: DUF2891 domain-containing protein [Lacibacter sp.]
MRFIFSLPVFLFSFLFTNAQDNGFFSIKKDSSGFTLTEKGAAHLASLPLKCIEQEYPNKTNHLSNSDSDHVLTPHQLHPSFYGCLDWHSSVHGHWMLVKLLKSFPNLTNAAEIRSILAKSFAAENILKEVKYFELPLAASWERTYGWAWLLKLDEELLQWNDADAKKWHANLQPLTNMIVDLWTKFLPKQTYPNRTGVHPNTAFGLVFALDYARATKNATFELNITKAALTLFQKDKNVPASWEPNGSDFLSPSLEVADLMRRVLPKKEFPAWFNQYMSATSLKHLFVLPVVSDRNDYQIVHLDGLCFSRSWCMNGIAKALPAGDARKKLLMRAAINHLTAALPNIVNGGYGGEHWLASFAVYALFQ